MKKLFSILFIIFFLACTPNKEKNEVFLFNDTSFKLTAGDSITDLKYQITENYQSYLTKSNIQIPLYKCILNKNYRIYIGIPYNTSIKKLIKIQIIDHPAGQVELKTDTLSYFFKHQNNDTTYISEFSKVFDKNLIYILAITNSKMISDSLFKHTELSNRFIQ